jgi:hypothetical protein
LIAPMPAIMVGGVPFLDSSVANTISRIARKARKRGVAVFVTGSSHTVRRALLTHDVRPPLHHERMGAIVRTQNQKYRFLNAIRCNNRVRDAGVAGSNPATPTNISIT